MMETYSALFLIGWIWGMIGAAFFVPSLIILLIQGKSIAVRTFWFGGCLLILAASAWFADAVAGTFPLF